MSKKTSAELPWASRADLIEAGCDEAGRGCLAGPVVAAAVILPPGFTHPWLNDSKQLSERRRDEMRFVIQENAVAWAVAEVSPQEIDRINILNASILAMHRALDRLAVVPEAVAVDGNRFKQWRQASCHTFVKGDGRFGNIAAASILAKTRRDEIMRQLASEFPGYGWETNVGYPTQAHRNAIAALGVTEHHRRSFQLLPLPSLFD